MGPGENSADTMTFQDINDTLPPLMGVDDPFDARGHITVMHFMEIYMGYEFNGEQTKVMIGLSNDIPIDCIFGIPFFIQTKTVKSK
jgi:hypothetical protein